MKKIGLFLVIAAIAAFGVTAADADAATNCVASTNHITYGAGTLNFTGTLSNCTDADVVQFDDLSPGYDGIWDATIGLFHTAIGCSGCTVNQSVLFLGVANAYYATQPWCGGAVRTVSSYFGYRIHNDVTHTWGSWHAYGGLWYYNINC